MTDFRDQLKSFLREKGEDRDWLAARMGVSKKQLIIGFLKNRFQKKAKVAPGIDGERATTEAG